MKRFYLLLVLSAFVLQGCAAAISAQNAQRREAVLNALKIGNTRSEVHTGLGQPYGSDGDYIEFYKINCPPSTGLNAARHLFNTVITAGLWEIVGSQDELAQRENEVDFVVVYNDDNKLANALLKEEYDTILRCYDCLNKVARRLSEDDGLMLARNYDSTHGWYFLDIKHIDCSFQDKYLKFYVKNVISPRKSLDYVKRLKLDYFPVYAYQTFVVDLKDNQFKLTSVLLFDERQEIVESKQYDQWTEIYPDSIIDYMSKMVAAYSLTKELEKTEKYREPDLRQFLYQRDGDRPI